MDSKQRIERTARWWKEATQEARFKFLQRIIGTKTPQKEDPSLAELRLAIILAEAESETIHEAGPTR